MRQLLLALPAAFILFSCTAQTQSNLTVSQFETAIQKIDSVQVLDVRTPGEYAAGHIQGAMQADWNNQPEFARRISFIDKSKPVYVYCLAGGRSAAAASRLRELGYAPVYDLAGGINAWKADRKPLEGNQDTPQMSIDDFNKAVNSATTVLVDFGAVWCPPCRKMEPVLKSLSQNQPGKFTLVKVDGGRDTKVLELYKVTALPVFILFKNGKQVWRKDGLVSESEIAAQL